MSADERPGGAADAPLVVVGLGASAGGLAALRKVFASTPKDGNVAYVVVVHLSPDHESYLADLLQGSSDLPVLQVTGDVSLRPNHVYVIPPGRNLSTIDSHLRLSPLEERRAERAPIDHFFRTLADQHRERAVAVILSGTGSDGAVGVGQVKEYGGLVVAQDPAEAEYAGMPESALATGLVDLVLPLADIPGGVLAYARREPRVELPADGERVRPDEGALLRGVLAQVRAYAGHDFAGYKPATVLRRVARRMQLRGTLELSAYLELLRRDPAEVAGLYGDLLISVTNFFRDPEVFAALERRVPELFEGKGPGESVRVWVVGCATGEEAYSVAMLLTEHASTLERPPEVQLFATDVSAEALGRAREGLYPRTIAGDVSEGRLKRFFTEEGEFYRVHKELRERVLFAPHNLLADPPFSRLDLVSCRNVLIYLRREVQNEALRVFHYALRPGGYLLLGNSEVPGDAEFRDLDKGAHLYRRSEVPAGELRLPNLPFARPAVPPPPLPQGGGEAGRYGALHARVVERYAPPSVLVDADGAIVHLSESAGRFLYTPGGEPTNDLLRRVRDELRAELRAALYEAVEAARPALSRPVPLTLAGEPREVAVQVRPAGGDLTGFTLVVFDERPPQAEAEPADAERELVGRLEARLEAAKRQLQTTVEEFEASREEMQRSNEELRSVNEELRSTAEELETSKEELGSINEELQTVNQENRHKVEELSQLTGDLQNLFAATDIATLFLDRGGRIKRFTPRVAELFSVRAADRGRPLSDLTHRLGGADLAGEAEATLRTLRPAERELRSDDGRWFLMRMLPYRTPEDRIDGTVLTFVDITERKEAEAVLHASEARQAFLLGLSDVLRPLSNAAEIQATVTRTAMNHFGAGRCYYCELEGGAAVVRQDASRDGLPSVAGVYPLSEMPVFKAVMDAGRPFVVADANSSELLDEALRRLCLELQVVAFIDVPVVKAGRTDGLLCITQQTPRAWTDAEVELAQEVAERTWAAVERAKAEAALRDSEEKYRALFSSMDQGYAVVEVLADEAGAWRDFLFLEVNPAFVAQTGMPYPVGRRATELLGTPNPQWAEVYGRVAETGEAVRLEQAEGTLGRTFDLYVFRLGGEGSRRVAVLFTDITERKRAERVLRDSEEHGRFLLRLADALRAEQGADAVANRALRMVSEQLGLDRCYLASYRLADDRADITHQLGNDRVPAMPDTIRLSDFPAAFRQVFDQTLVIGDAAETAGLSDTDRGGMGALGLRALVAATLRRGETNPHWVMVAVSARPRRWTPDEVALIEEVAERTWAALERARTEEALRESQRFMQGVIASLPLAVYIFDFERRKNLYLSPQVSRLFGYTAEEMQGSGEGLLPEFFHPDDLPRVAAYFDEIGASGGAGVWSLECRMKHKERGWVWVVCRDVVYARDAAGRPTQLLGTAEDITGRKEAEAALQGSEARFRALIERSAEAITVSAADGTITFASLSIEAISGYTVAEFRGRDPFAAGDFHPDDAARCRAVFDELLENPGRSLLLRHRYRHRSGAWRWLEGTFTSLFHVPEVGGLVANFRDVTERVAAETALRDLNETLERRVEERTEALSESERRFAQAFHVAPIPTCITTGELHADREVFLDVNEAFAGLTGYGRDEVLGKTARDLGMWSSPEDQKALEAAGPGGFQNVGLKLRTKAGEARDVLLSSEPIRLGDETGFLKMFYDVTARRETEEQVQRAISEVVSDTSWFSHKVMERLANIRAGGDPKETVQLTKRERQVLELIASGQNNEAIAAALGVATQTVRNYISTIYSKLGVGSRAEAIVWARERGIVGG